MKDGRPGLLEIDDVIDLWPQGAPGMPTPPPVETIVERGTNGTKHDRAVAGIDRPRMIVHRPDIPNGTAVIAMPGGGYRWLAVDKEAFEIAPLLTAHGYTVFTLLYRLPGEGWEPGHSAPLADAQRAVRLVRHRAAQFGIAVDRVVALGFSAGGHVAGTLATQFDRQVHAPVDDADALDARPDLAALIYPVQEMARPFAHEESRRLLLGPDPSPALETAYTLAARIDDRTPPCFLVHAEDDPVVAVDNTLLLRRALKDRGIPVETHLYVRGGHGFGVCEIAPPTVLWHQRFIGWMTDNGLGR